VDGGIDAGVDAGRTVSVIATTVFTNGTAQTVVPVDTRDAGLVLLGGVGLSTSIIGVGSSSGVTTFADAPPGEVLIKSGSRYFATTRDRLELDQHVLGRAGAAVTDGGTTLHLGMTGLDPWTDFDDLHMLAPGAGLGVLAMANVATSFPNQFDTTYAFEGDYLRLATSAVGGTTAPLLDAAAGDVVYVLQTRTATGVDGGLGEETVTVRAATTTLSMTDKVVNIAAVALASNPRTWTYAWRRSNTASWNTAVHPSAVRVTERLSLSAIPSNDESGAVVDWFASVLPTNDFADRSGTWVTSDPFPPAWQRVVTASILYRVRATMPDGGSANPAYAATFTAFADAGLLPELSSPRELRLNGVLVSSDQIIAPTASTLTWLPPTQGIARQFVVLLREVTSSGSSFVARQVGTFYTTQTQLSVPPGLLVTGHSYVFSVLARQLDGDLELHPLHDEVPSQSNVVVSASARPAAVIASRITLTAVATSARYARTNSLSFAASAASSARAAELGAAAMRVAMVCRAFSNGSDEAASHSASR
jgi:hypothetical protein